MPSLIRDQDCHRKGRKPSPYWIAVMSIAGRRVWKSTKVRVIPHLYLDLKEDGKTLKTKEELKEEACKVACAIERGLRAQFEGTAVEANLRRIFADAIADHHSLQIPTIEGWLNDWLAARRASITEASMAKYGGIRNSFLESLGARRTARLNSISSNDFVHYRDQLVAEGRSNE